MFSRITIGLGVINLGLAVYFFGAVSLIYTLAWIVIGSFCLSVGINARKEEKYNASIK